MGQTLTHGVYLPDEGERNCYSGLAANWQILDTSVGTIAAHTAALAGKAPLVHTHAKSDITDLLNSDFIPSANNSYDLGSSSYQWNNLYAKRVNTQSVNGVNPGALNIPNKNSKADIASEFTDLTGGNNFYIPPADGFVSINADTEIYCAVVSSTHNTAFWRQSAVATSAGNASITIPVRAGLHLLAKIKSTGAIYAEFYPCLGNV